MFFHFSWELLNGDGTICVTIHFFEEKLDLIFSYVRVDVPEKIAKLVVVHFVFDSHTMEKVIKVKIFWVNLES